jgi:hypothetical protein
VRKVPHGGGVTEAVAVPLGMLVEVEVRVGDGVDVSDGVGVAVRVDQCPLFDCNGTGQVTVDCIIQAVDAALNGCGSEPTPSATSVGELSGRNASCCRQQADWGGWPGVVPRPTWMPASAGMTTGSQ